MSRRIIINGRNTFKDAEGKKATATTFNFKAEVEIRNLAKTMRSLSEMLHKDIKHLTIEAAAKAAKAASQYTKPQVGLRNPRKLLRTMLTLRRFFNDKTRQLEMLPQKAWRYQVIIEKNSRKGARAPHLANGAIRNFSQLGNRITFAKKSDAEKWRKIPGRGMARSGWWGNIPKLQALAGFQLETNLNNIKTTRRVTQKSVELSAVSVTDDGYTVSVSNKFPNIAEFGAVSKFMGYKSVANQWDAWRKKEEKKIKDSVHGKL